MIEPVYLQYEGLDELYKGKQSLVLIIYDITDNKRRRDMVKLLASYGIRVQKSAFECLLEPALVETLVKRAPRLILEDEDSLRIYDLHGRVGVMSWGKGDSPEESEGFVIV